MKKYLSFLLLIALTSCNTTKEEISVCSFTVGGEFIDDEYIFPMNTITTLKMYYKSQFDEVSNAFSEIVTSYSKEVDRYHLYTDINNLKTINDSCGSNKAIKVSDELIDILSLGIDLTILSEGKFNLAMGSLIDLYAPLLEQYNGTLGELPSSNEIEIAKASVPSYLDINDVIIIDKENKEVTLNNYNDNKVIISLGAIAKGYVMQKAYDYLSKFNYPCLFDAGSSTMALLGSQPLRKDGNFNISFRNPSIPNSYEAICTLALKDNYSISTSSDYEQNFFYDDNKLMHHIIDATTGVSNNVYRSVSLVSQDASLAILDALSTAIFNTSDINEAKNLISLVENKYNYKIDYLFTLPYETSYTKYNAYISAGFNELITSKDEENVISWNIL